MRGLEVSEPTPRFWEIFFELFEGLPRQGPGNRASAERALGLCRGLPPAPAVLDLGCGVGGQTLHLAELLLLQRGPPANPCSHLDDRCTKPLPQGLAQGLAHDRTKTGTGSLRFPFDSEWLNDRVGYANALAARVPESRDQQKKRGVDSWVPRSEPAA